MPGGFVGGEWRHEVRHVPAQKKGRKEMRSKVRRGAMPWIHDAGRAGFKMPWLHFSPASLPIPGM